MKQTLKPVYSDIGILESCNLKCKMCKMYEIPSLKKNQLIPIERWKLFFKDLRQIAGPGFVFNIPGGEPLLHPNIFKIIKIASNNELKPLLSTNAFLITNDIAHKLIKNGLAAVTISLDSSNEELHDDIRGKKGTYKKVQRAIRLLTYYKKLYNKEFSIGIQSVVQESNLNNIVDVVNFAQNNPLIDRINLNLLMKPNNSKDDPNWYKNEFKDIWPKNNTETDDLFDELIELKNQKKISKLLNTVSQLRSYKVYFRNPKKTPKLVNCKYDKAVCTNSSGDIHLCFYYDSVGNLKKDRLIDVWNSKKANNIRKKIHKCEITDCWFRLNCLYSD